MRTWCVGRSMPSTPRPRLYGRALIATDDDELGIQLGQQAGGWRPRRASIQPRLSRRSTQATKDALSGGARFPERAHGTAAAGARRSHALVQGLQEPPRRPCCGATVASRRALASIPSATTRWQARRPPAASESVAASSLLRTGQAGRLRRWAGLAKPHGQRLWDQVAGDLVEVRSARATWLMKDDSAPRVPAHRRGLRWYRPATPTCRRPTFRCSPRRRFAQAACFGPWQAGRRAEEGRLAGLCASSEWKKAELQGREGRPPRAPRPREEASAWPTCAEPRSRARARLMPAGSGGILRRHSRAAGLRK